MPSAQVEGIYADLKTLRAQRTSLRGLRKENLGGCRHLLGLAESPALVVALVESVVMDKFTGEDQDLMRMQLAIGSEPWADGKNKVSQRRLLFAGDSQAQADSIRTNKENRALRRLAEALVGREEDDEYISLRRETVRAVDLLMSTIQSALFHMREQPAKSMIEEEYIALRAFAMTLAMAASVDKGVVFSADEIWLAHSFADDDEYNDIANWFNDTHRGRQLMLTCHPDFSAREVSLLLKSIADYRDEFDAFAGTLEGSNTGKSVLKKWHRWLASCACPLRFDPVDKECLVHWFLSDCHRYSVTHL